MITVLGAFEFRDVKFENDKISQKNFSMHFWVSVQRVLNVIFV